MTIPVGHLVELGKNPSTYCSTYQHYPSLATVLLLILHFFILFGSAEEIHS